jgi:hypothetical protein
MTKYPDLFAALAAPFESHEIKTRSTRSGIQLSYITARTAMNRLDTVLGPENWWDEFVPTEHSVLCKLTIRLPDGSTVTKQDAAGYAGMETRTRTGEMIRDDENDEKSGYSDAFKRAAAKFGVARYLYRDGVPNFVRERQPEVEAAAAQASPIAGEPANGKAPEPTPRPQRSSRGSSGPPRSGRSLFAWVKDQEARHGSGLLQYLNKWGKLQEYPGRMVDWDDDQVALAYSEALRKLQATDNARDEAYEEALSN